MGFKYIAISSMLLLALTLLLPGGDASSGGLSNSAAAGPPQSETSLQAPQPVPSQDLSNGLAPDRILFIENAGQFDPAARFQVWAGPGTAWLAEDAIWLTVVERSNVDALERFDPQRVNVERENVQRENVQRVNVKLSFPGANPHPALEPFDRLDTHVSYFIGNDRAKWRADVPVWGGVRYRDLYPGFDLEMTGTGDRWAWRLVRNSQHPELQGALSAVRNPPVTLRVEGADGAVAEEDALRVTTAAGDLTLPLLTAERSNVGRANVERADVQRANRGTFDVAAPFASVPPRGQSTITNPQSSGLPYATFLGGSTDEQGASIAVNSAREAYITGVTTSLDFPAGPGYDTGPDSAPDAYVAKLNAAGTGLLYATFLGGSSDDYGSGIAVDHTGEVYVAGATASPDFPASLGPGYDTTHNSLFDAYVVKLNSTGTALRYATFLGGSDDDLALDIAVDSTCQAYVTGYTESGNFPASLGPGYDTTHNGARDVFIVKLDAAGAALPYATFLGGSADEEGFGITVDGTGEAYVTGYTWSAGFPASLGPGYDTTHNDSSDAYVVKLDATGAALLYANFLGGSSADEGRAIAVDDAYQAYVTGFTYSPDFPASLGPGYDATSNGNDDAFVVKLDEAGTELDYATFLGGSGWDYGDGIAVDASGQAYVTGRTDSPDFPTDRRHSYDATQNGGFDAFVVKLDVAGAALRYATFLGGSDYDQGYDIATDGTGQAYVTGDTGSADFPADRGPGYDTSFNGGYADAFAVKLDTTAITQLVWLPLIMR